MSNRRNMAVRSLAAQFVAVLPSDQPCACEQHQEERGGKSEPLPFEWPLRPKFAARRLRAKTFGQLERARLVAERAEQFFEPLNLFVRLARLVPQVVAHKLYCSFPPVPCSRARSNFMPRCMLTRTDAGASPVRTAISGPVMPSTKRKIKGSR